MDEKDKPVDYSKPVAYDTNGRPLYAHPPIESSSAVITSDEVKLKHIKSEKVFPDLKLGEGDYVITSIRRHPIGMLAPLAVGVMVTAVIFLALFNYDSFLTSFQMIGLKIDQSIVFWLALLFIFLILIAEYIVYFVYSNNKFFLTNDSIIQQVQTGIFSNSEHIINLGNIKDTSYSQNGIIQQLFNYGIIRLSTEGDDTEYKFTFVVSPKDCVITLDNAIENYKNCRRPC
jgi:hypothetical protein